MYTIPCFLKERKNHRENEIDWTTLSFETQSQVQHHAFETMERLMWCLGLNHEGMKALFVIKFSNEESDISFSAYCLELIPLEDKLALRQKGLSHPTI